MPPQRVTKPHTSARKAKASAHSRRAIQEMRKLIVCQQYIKAKTEAQGAIEDIYNFLLSRAGNEIAEHILGYLATSYFPDAITIDDACQPMTLRKMSQSCLPWHSKGRTELVNMLAKGMVRELTFSLKPVFPTNMHPATFPYPASQKAFAHSIYHLRVELQIPSRVGVVHGIVPAYVFSAQEHIPRLAEFFPLAKTVTLHLRISSPDFTRPRDISPIHACLPDLVKGLIEAVRIVKIRQRYFIIRSEDNKYVPQLGPREGVFGKALMNQGEEVEVPDEKEDMDETEIWLWGIEGEGDA